MKIAICYSGFLPDNFEICFNHHINTMHLLNHKVDYFMYIWENDTYEIKKNFLKMINLKMIMSGSTKLQYHPGNNNNNITNDPMYYALMKANLLRKHYELINNEKYDCVIRMDPSIGFEHQMDLNGYDMNKLNILNLKFS